MLSTFDYEKLGSLLKDFHGMTGIRITVFDDAFQEIIAYPQALPPVCRYIRSDSDAAVACRQCDINACRMASSLHAPYVYRCHAGLTEAVAPVYLGGIPVAYLLFGHLFSYSSESEGRDAVLAVCGKYDLDPAVLKDFITNMTMTEETYILSASHILQAVASYLCMDRMVTLHQQETMAKVDEYISCHFTENIDVPFLCERFGVGKTSLYAFAKQNYGCGIAEHIRHLRIDHAKKLLIEDPSMSVADVAERCGFTDYNYFITVFGKLAGMPPRRFKVLEGQPVNRGPS